MPYKVEQNKIVEKGTNLVVYKSDTVDDITGVCRTLNLGGGFTTTKKSSDELTTS